MKINSVTSESNATLKLIRSLHKRSNREKQQLFLLEGSHCLQEACKRELDLQAIVASQSFITNGRDELNELEIEQITVVEDKLFAELMTTTSSCGVLAVAPIPKESSAEITKWTPRVILIVDAVQDPGNLGTLFRSALAAEIGGVVLMRGCVDAYNPKTVRAAAGALFDMPMKSDVVPADLINSLKSNGYRLVACEAKGSISYFECDLSDKVALILGNEGQGVSEDLLAGADEKIRIPMNPKSESLNVAISGGIILFETYRQRLSGRGDAAHLSN